MRRLLLAVAVGAWIATVAGAGHALMLHTGTPGAPAVAPRDWPIGVGVEPSKTRPTLVCFVHPQCPCTRATAAELARLIARTGIAFDTVVLAYAPTTPPRDWQPTMLLGSLDALPATTVVSDPDGATARRFGAATSGQVMLFDRGGMLLFSGGITSSRGHEGDSEGAAAIARLVSGPTLDIPPTPVFGCPILTEDVSTEPAR